MTEGQRSAMKRRAGKKAAKTPGTRDPRNREVAKNERHQIPHSCIKFVDCAPETAAA